MTYATDKGLVVGQKYIFQSEGDYCDGRLDGKAIEFKTDDGTLNPAFVVPFEIDSDGWDFLPLTYISAPAVETGVATFSFTVSATQTDIIIGKPLTAAEVAKVLEAAGVK